MRQHKGQSAHFEISNQQGQAHTAYMPYYQCARLPALLL
jgi:hypothetical protein